jgi:coproporphyrinogen III oxidase-like Fe-S oxidoreductase
MLTTISKRMMRRSFEKTIYRFGSIPRAVQKGTFGIYMHVPFCPSKCSFCPFYKELYSDALKDRYLDAVKKEISESPIRGKAKWLYIGGGTPNILSIRNLDGLLKTLSKKVQLETVGIELMPSLLDEKYLDDLKRIGITKISIGVESFADQVMSKTGRKNDTTKHITNLVHKAASLDLWVNIDLLIGLPNQTRSIFLDDIEKVARLRPSQVTIYPFMTIRGLKAEPGMPTKRQFQLTEIAAHTLESNGYRRKGVWTFTRGDDVYDSSRDELVIDYFGFGPAAFSTYGDQKVVNLELDAYLKSMQNGHRMGFVAPKPKGTDEWRRFAGMLYDLDCHKLTDVPRYMNFYLSLLRATGYGKHGRLTEKGTLFSHALTKEVVESLPFPIQNPAIVENYDEYLSYKTER